MADEEKVRRQPASPKRVMKRMAAGSYGGHTDMYRWLRRRHSTIEEAFDKHDPSWLTIADTMAAEGVKGRGGCRPTADTVRKAWSRVCRDIRDEAHFQATGVSKKRQIGVRQVAQSAIAPVPTNAAKPAAPVGPGQAVQSAFANPGTLEMGDTKPGVAGPVGREVAKARLAEVRRALNARSGR